MIGIGRQRWGLASLFTTVFHSCAVAIAVSTQSTCAGTITSDAVIDAASPFHETPITVKNGTSALSQLKNGVKQISRLGASPGSFSGNRG